jgi:hypothetical protein
LEPALLTEEGLNNFQCLAYFYDPDGIGGPGNILDALYLEVHFKADRVALPTVEETFMAQPGEVRWLDTIDVTDEYAGTLAQSWVEEGVQIGTSDDVTTVFSFESEDYGAITEGSEVVYIDGVETTNYSIVYDGAIATITFDTAPLKVEAVETVIGEHVGTGDNVQTVFSLGDTPIENSTIVYIDGVETNDTYWPNTVDHEAGTITFDTAPENNSYTGVVEGEYVGTGDGETKISSFAHIEYTPDEDSMIVYVNGSTVHPPPSVNYEAMTIKFKGGTTPAEGADITVDYTYTYWVAMVITADYDHIVIVGVPITVDFEWVDQTLTFGLRNIGPIVSGTDIVYLDDTVTTDYSIDYVAGIITFPALTPAPARITVDYTYDTESTVWPLQEEDVGTYIVTITIYYSYAGLFYIPGTKHVISETWRCLPAK